MPITSVDTTNVTVRCPIDRVLSTFTVASLEAGAKGGQNQILYPTLVCGHTNLTHIRTFDNPAELSGAINGLHEHLIDLAQVSSFQPQLSTEPANEKPDPVIVFAITASPITPAESNATGLWFGWDLTAAAVLKPASELQKAIDEDRIFTAESNANIGAFTSALFASQADKDDATERLKERRDLELS